ncbi:tetratricopeptide repeat protein [Nannocystis sp. SCPEA4]|uniref:tetratricopeptide repeat protein n=1 Tax=Nannocystis sp. SCPEA4 TaxID=2996787 RepID=UPI00226F5DAE|nr:tetratricopeptide repeat protein [Nannocystis sp. SCPEA4]MCY1061450.1 tetratricopeptide repeat protein [Nannocystis sp. SCPEA4]
MIEPLDDELREYTAALRAVDRPSAAARAAAWNAIDARIAPATVPLRRVRTTWAVAAIAAALLLCVGLVAATAWRGRTAGHVEAEHQSPGEPAPLPLAPRQSTATSLPLVGASTQALPALDASLPDAPDASPSTDASPPIIAPKVVQSSHRDTGPRRRPRPDADPSLRPEEVASFQRAQAALAAGRHEDALAALDAHGRRFPGGVFEEERQVSRATALCKLGDREAASAARQKFLRERPSSHLAERMRQICREIE